MGLLNLLAALLRAWVAYMELKVRSFEHDRYVETRDRIYEYEDHIESLRNSGTHSDTVLADRMRARLQTEKAYFKHLPGTDPETGTRDQGSDG